MPSKDCVFWIQIFEEKTKLSHIESVLEKNLSLRGILRNKMTKNGLSLRERERGSLALLTTSEN